jgi:AAA domain
MTDYETPEDSRRRVGIVEMPIANKAQARWTKPRVTLISDGAQAIETSAPPIRPRFRTLAEFIAEYQPVAEVVADLLSAGSLYTLTANTGVGKTAWLSSTALAIGTGRADIIGRPVTKGRVAFCTAENPDGLKMRLAVTAFHWHVDPAVIGRDVLVSDMRVKPELICEDLKRDAEEHGPFTAVFVDTWQAFFDGKDSNNPTDAVDFTRRFRPLTRLPGGPVVIIATHPVKRAGNDDLLPAGGGSILNEVDGNLTLSRQPSGVVAFGWQGKLRGLDFDPPLFRIENRSSPDILNVAGKQVKIPVMLPISQTDAEDREDAIARRDANVLRAVAENPQAPIRALAFETSLPRTSVARSLNKMAKVKHPLVRQELDKWVVTKAGKEAIHNVGQ